mmetsp:Transcript_13043/g.19250  ORF Transcript_13043/g.19250 Transcript_13043/m.19250 type:complete len:929 (-) Transcript_13043:181-2967(-)
MRFGFKLSKLLGSIYGNGSGGGRPFSPEMCFTMDGNSLLSPIGNRVISVDLVRHRSSTLGGGLQARQGGVVCLAPSPCGRVVAWVDEGSRLMLVHLEKGTVLGRLTLREGGGGSARVRALEFSPDGRYLAAAVGREVQVWLPPPFLRPNTRSAPAVSVSGFALHLRVVGSYDQVACLGWGPDSDTLVAGSRDLTARIYRMQPPAGYIPVTLSGHRNGVIACFVGPELPVRQVYTIAKDGAVFVWERIPHATAGGEGPEETASSAKPKGAANKKRKLASKAADWQMRKYQVADEAGQWRLAHKEMVQPSANFFCNVRSAAFHAESGLLVVGFVNGVFGLWELPSCSLIHTLSVGRQAISSCAINRTGDWLALGAPDSGQILVWEWRSETYVLKQQGHNYGISSLAFSPNGNMLVTGGDDSKLKLWNCSSGFCFVTFGEHKAPVSAVAFTQEGQVVVSASLDGSVRAHDLVRYKCFRTMTPPHPAQLLSLAVDPSGEVVAAGALEPAGEVYLWSLQTGKLLDVLPAHEAPVGALDFGPAIADRPLLATGSWDGRARLWDVYKATPLEAFDHQSDVLDVAFRPDGKQICCASLNGLLSFWCAESGRQEHTIEGQHDVTGGRKQGQKVEAQNLAATKHFTSVCYTSDGSCVIAAGESKFVCIYEISQQILVKKFQLSLNVRLDGILDKLHSRHMTDAGVSQETLALRVQDQDQEEDDARQADSGVLPGARARAMDGGKRGMLSRQAVRATCVRFSPAGKHWAVATPDGVLLYSLDQEGGGPAGGIFEPFDLDEEISPQAIQRAMEQGEGARAILMSLHLNEQALVAKAVDSVPPDSIEAVASSMGTTYLQRLMFVLARQMAESPHLGYYLKWSLALLTHHGAFMKANSTAFSSAFRSLHKSLLRHQQDLFKLCDENQYMLKYLLMLGRKTAN